MKKPFLLLSFLILIILACSVPNLFPTAVPQVVTPTITPLVVPSQTPTSFAPIPLTSTPSSTPSLTPSLGSPIFIANTPANCRQGPSTEYPVVTGILKGQAVPILGRTTPERPLWWLVEKSGVRCWVSGILGITGGDVSGVFPVLAPPTPTPSRKMIDVLFENNTDGYICRMDFYVGIDIVTSFTWKKGEFDNDGADMIISLPVGGYDLIEVYSCKPELSAVLTNVVINENNHAFALPQLP